MRGREGGRSERLFFFAGKEKGRRGELFERWEEQRPRMDLVVVVMLVEVAPDGTINTSIRSVRRERRKRTRGRKCVRGLGTMGWGRRWFSSLHLPAHSVPLASFLRCSHSAG